MHYTFSKFSRIGFFEHPETLPALKICAGTDGIDGNSLLFTLERHVQRRADRLAVPVFQRNVRTPELRGKACDVGPERGTGGVRQ